MSAIRILASTLLVAGAAISQQQVWQIHGPVDHWYEEIAGFNDFDGDGVRDFLVSYQYFTAPYTSHRRAGIASGSTGALLWHTGLYTSYVRQAGDVNGDGSHEFVAMGRHLAYTPGWVLLHGIEVRSPVQGGQVLWTAYGESAIEYGFDVLGDIDTDGDGFSNVITISRGRLLPPTWAHVEAYVYVYNNRGQELYRLDLATLGYEPVSLAKMGDLDGDGCEDFVVGCADAPQFRGAVHLISGRTGTILRTGFGLLPGDKTAALATNVGDIDGDGVTDFAAFPWWSASRLMATIWSGATAAVIRTMPEYTESVIATEDLDRDGVRDLVLGWDYPVLLPNVYGRTIALSGRDGSRLWKVEKFLGSHSSNTGWAWRSAGLGVPPGAAYPRIAWLDSGYYHPSQPIPNAVGRVRAFDGSFTGQGPVSGTPCASSGPAPWIGARDTTSGARVTIAKGQPGAYAWLNLAVGNPTQYLGLPLPIALDPFGLHGCQMYVGPEITFFRQLGTTGIDRGYAAVDLPVQLAASLGTIVQAQWLAYDPATGWYGATEQHQLRLP